MHKEDENNIHPNAPAGRDGPGAFRSAGPLGTNPNMEKWFKPNPLGLEPPSTGVGSLLPVYGLNSILGDAEGRKLGIGADLKWDDVKKDFERWEGKYSYMYLDSKGYVTVGIGKMLPNATAAQILGFVRREDGKAALAKEIETDFNEVKKQVSNKIASSYKKHTKLDLPDEAIYSLLKTVVDGFDKNLENYYKGFKTYPSSAKRALLDMIYNLGFGSAAIEAGKSTKEHKAKGLHLFTTLKEAVEVGDWEMASKNCHRVGPAEARNNWTRDLFLEAAKSTKSK